MMEIRCLVTGATGYIGGRLAPRLLEAGHSVRCLTRDAARLRDVPWVTGNPAATASSGNRATIPSGNRAAIPSGNRAEVVEADLTRPQDLAKALEGIDVAYYLVHSLGAPDFESTDRLSASNFAAAAARAKVKRIVYLGGPEPGDDTASPHLRSRDEVGAILSASGVPTVILRAAVIIGSGSASFEMLRYLTERLPVMVTPSWVGNRIQPIAVRDVLYYLLAWASVPEQVNRSFDIGGATILTYADMMRRYARVAKLPPRVILPVRTLTPWLSSQWIGLVTPVPGRIAKPLVLSLTEEAVCREHDIEEYVPDPPGGLKPFDEAVSLALARIRRGGVETRWANAAWTGAPADPLPTDPDWSGGTIYRDIRQCEVAAEPDNLWDMVARIGGETGWYSFPLAWAVRGWLDRVIGGVGLRRGRRDPQELYIGEALDFWRVEAIEPGRLLRLRAEMRLPGAAWLEMRVGDGPIGSHYEQRATFVPRGLAGHAYWWAIFPFHALVFGGMARNLAHAAERRKSR